MLSLIVAVALAQQPEAPNPHDPQVIAAEIRLKRQAAVARARLERQERPMNPTIARRKAKKAAVAVQNARAAEQERADGIVQAEQQERIYKAQLEHQRAMAPLMLQAEANAIQARRNQIIAEAASAANRPVVVYGPLRTKYNDPYLWYLSLRYGY